MSDGMHESRIQATVFAYMAGFGPRWKNNKVPKKGEE